ncbi:Hypothetical predicted protein [Cloeon dipterum]|uniref:C2H2-type domain-containing protein n=1 Tax=Cloeon dipterum TaxID=197152 RepID=A0A8S1DM16_9INSE|nr:Hypothetical predicted protein [Cloeon dipterum]
MFHQYPITECFFCGKPALGKQNGKIVEKINAKTSTIITAALCISCSHRDELKFTMADLSEISKVPLEKLKNYACIANPLRAFPENIPDSKIKEIVIGISDRYQCQVCWEFIELSKRVEDHNTERRHPLEIPIFWCNSGCGLSYRISSRESHKAECGILCPVKYCKKKFAVDTGHFVHVHPCVTCPINGCATAFQNKRNELGEAESGINELLMHIMTTHVWEIKKFAETG